MWEGSEKDHKSGFELEPAEAQHLPMRLLAHIVIKIHDKCILQTALDLALFAYFRLNCLIICHIFTFYLK